MLIGNTAGIAYNNIQLRAGGGLTPIFGFIFFFTPLMMNPRKIGMYPKSGCIFFLQPRYGSSEPPTAALLAPQGMRGAGGRRGRNWRWEHRARAIVLRAVASVPCISKKRALVSNRWFGSLLSRAFELVLSVELYRNMAVSFRCRRLLSPIMRKRFLVILLALSFAIYMYMLHSAHSAHISSLSFSPTCQPVATQSSRAIQILRELQVPTLRTSRSLLDATLTIR